MNAYVKMSVFLASTTLVLGASIGSGPKYRKLEPTLEDQDNQHTAALNRVPRQLGASSFLSNALGGIVGQLPLVGGALQSPVSMLLQQPLSSSLSSITGGLVNRISPYPDVPFGYFGGSLEYQPHQFYRSLPVADARAYPGVYVY